MQSPDQSPVWIPGNLGDARRRHVDRQPAGVSGISFEGAIGGDLGAITGTFTQGNVKLPLVLKREKN